MNDREGSRPPQHQPRQPGRERQMEPSPVYDRPEQRGCGRLLDKTALVTGGDSGIGRAVAIAYAKEGADVAIAYLDEHDDAKETVRHVERYGRRAIRLAGDVGDPDFCREAVKTCLNTFGKLDILVNNAGEQHLRAGIADIAPEELERTFRTNLFSMFYLAKEAVSHLPEGGSIINTTSITAYMGHPGLLYYSATKGAIVSFTRSLSQSLVESGIRVNAVAPGPVWTPLIPATFPGEKVAHFGENKPMGRAGEPVEIASSYVFLASEEASFISGQVLHPNGGAVVNG